MRRAAAVIAARLRELACDRAVWPATRDLVFTYEAGAEDPRDWQPDLPEIPILPVAQAIYAALSPGRVLPPLAPIEGHTYNFGEDRASVAPEGDGILVADYWPAPATTRERTIAIVAVHHVLVRDEVAAIVESGSSRQRRARPEVTVQLSAATGAIDVATDAILLVAPTLGLALVRRDDAPVRTRREQRGASQINVFARLVAGHGLSVATTFAWHLVGLFPPWLDDAAVIEIEHASEYRDVNLVVRNPRLRRRQIAIPLGSSRVIPCIATGDGVREEGRLDMHYVPSPEQLERARTNLACALHWLYPEQPFAAELAARIPPGRVFPPD